jgi:hypothetical protein
MFYTEQYIVSKGEILDVPTPGSAPIVRFPYDTEMTQLFLDGALVAFLLTLTSMRETCIMMGTDERLTDRSV